MKNAEIDIIKMHPTQAGVVYVSAGGAGNCPPGPIGLYKSRDAGMTWRRLPNRSNVWSVQMDVGGRFAYVRFGYDPGGEYWRLDLLQDEMKSISPPGCEEIYTDVAISPTQPGQLIAFQNPPGVKIEIIRSQNAGESWETVTENPPTEPDSLFMVIHPVDPNIIYICDWFLFQRSASGKVYKTTDGGQTWIELKTGLPPFRQAPVQIFISPVAPQTVYLLAHGVEDPVGKWSRIYRSDDAGAHWRSVPLPDVLESKQEWIQQVAISPNHPDRVYVMTHQFRFFELTANGEWVEKSNGLPPRLDRESSIYPYVSSLVADGKMPNQLYSSIITEDRKHPHSVYVKPDADSPWKTFSVGLENVEVNALSINPVNRLLYAATTAGIYFTPLYDGAPAFQSYLRAGIVESRLFQNYPNPFSDTTYLPYQLLQSSHVALEIHDLVGHLVQSLELGVQAEEHYVLPNRALSWDRQNVAGESVADGIYFYTLKVNGKPIDTKRMAVMKSR